MDFPRSLPPLPNRVHQPISLFPRPHPHPIVCIFTLAAFRKRGQDAGLSARAADFAAQSLRPSSRCTYDARLADFLKWCAQFWCDQYTASLGRIADFLVSLFGRNGFVPTIRGYRSALPPFMQVFLMARQCIFYNSSSSPDFWSLSSWSARLLAPWFLLEPPFGTSCLGPLCLRLLISYHLEDGLSPCCRFRPASSSFRFSRSIRSLRWENFGRQIDSLYRLPYLFRLGGSFPSFLPWPPFTLFPRIRSGVQSEL